MTDLELLEVAAKAMGLKVRRLRPRHCGGLSSDRTLMLVEEDKEGRARRFVGYWQPIDDDSDAFRLGVATGVLGSREVRHHKAVLMLLNGYDMFELERRAIVLAVAESQRAKEAQ